MDEKDEMSQLIQNKKRELARKDQIEAERIEKVNAFIERQRIRMKPLKKMVDTLIASIDPKYIASYEVNEYGDDENHLTFNIWIRTKDDSWGIEPDTRFESSEEGNSIWSEANKWWEVDSGFRVQKFLDVEKFETEEGVIKYLSESIAEVIALEQYGKEKDKD